LRVAFYAPLKPPDHPTPSGDRQVCRNLIRALQDAGHRVELASRLQSRDGRGDPARQSALRQQGDEEAARLVGGYRSRTREERPDLWFTYHLYYKAPDWIGPKVASALSIPRTEGRIGALDSLCRGRGLRRAQACPRSLVARSRRGAVRAQAGCAGRHAQSLRRRLPTGSAKIQTAAPLPRHRAIPRRVIRQGPSPRGLGPADGNGPGGALASGGGHDAPRRQVGLLSGPGRGPRAIGRSGMVSSRRGRRGGQRRGGRGVRADRGIARPLHRRTRPGRPAAYLRGLRHPGLAGGERGLWHDTSGGPGDRPPRCGRAYAGGRRRGARPGMRLSDRGRLACPLCRGPWRPPGGRPRP
jgi:hypothetical protein